MRPLLSRDFCVSRNVVVRRHYPGPERLWLLSFMFVLAACSSTTAQSTPTTGPVAEPATTAEVTSSTTETAATPTGPVDMCGRGLVLEPGAIHIADCFVESVSLEVGERGWSASPAEPDAVTVTFTDRSDGLVVAVALIILDRNKPPDEVLEVVASMEGITAIADPVATEISGHPGLYMDVQGAPRGGNTDALDEPRPSHSCPPRRPVRYKDGGNTIFGQVGAIDEIGVGYCHVARIWVVEVDGRAVTLIGGTADPDRHEEAVAKSEELFDGLSIEPDGGS